MKKYLFIIFSFIAVLFAFCFSSLNVNASSRITINLDMYDYLNNSTGRLKSNVSFSKDKFPYVKAEKSFFYLNISEVGSTDDSIFFYNFLVTNVDNIYFVDDGALIPAQSNSSFDLKYVDNNLFVYCLSSSLNEYVVDNGYDPFIAFHCPDISVPCYFIGSYIYSFQASSYRIVFNPCNSIDDLPFMTLVHSVGHTSLASSTAQKYGRPAIVTLLNQFITEYFIDYNSTISDASNQLSYDRGFQEGVSSVTPQLDIKYQEGYTDGVNDTESGTLQLGITRLVPTFLGSFANFFYTIGNFSLFGFKLLDILTAIVGLAVIFFVGKKLL